MAKSGYKIDKKKFQEVFDNHLKEAEEGNRIASSLHNILDKSFYEMNGDPASWKFPACNQTTPMQWLRIDQLPNGDIGDSDCYKPKERIQGLLNNLRGFNDKCALLLVRQDKYTSLYLGAYSEKRGTAAGRNLQKVANIHLPGAAFSTVADKREVNRVFDAMPYCGLITGQPSIRWNERENPLQTLDKLAGGLRDYDTGTESNYALLIIAEPTSDQNVKEILEKIQILKTDLSSYRKYSHSINLQNGSGDGSNVGGSISFGKSIAVLALTAAGLSAGLGPFAFSIANAVVNNAPAISTLTGSPIGAISEMGTSVYGGKSKHRNTGLGEGLSFEHANYEVDYCMNLLDKMVTRLEQGRNQGFWNSCIYVLAGDNSVVDLVASTARSVYAGQDSYMEPLRIFNFGNSRTVNQHIRGMQFLPLPVDNQIQELSRELSGNDEWHIFGPLYEMMSTPVNTEELSILMSIPRKDTAGIEITQDAVEFSTNPPEAEGLRTISMGSILNMGARNGHSFVLDIDQLNSHGLIVGLNGSGKSVTSRNVLDGMLQYNIPFMILDPVKFDYVRWADTYNRTHKGNPGFKPIRIYAPGYESIPGISTPIQRLQMNPFLPYGAKNSPVNVMSHVSSLLAILQPVMAMGDFLPMLLDEAVYNYLAGVFGPDVVNGAAVDPEDLEGCPTFSDLRKQIDALLTERNYSKENTDNFRAAFNTRINNLTRGWKKDFFEAKENTSTEELFEGNVVICLAGVTDNRDKAFLMSLILLALREYRDSCYQYDLHYREEVDAGRKKYHGNYLRHYTVVEEAHRILQVPRSAIGTENAQSVVAERFCEMLSEIREPGEGLMIIDQYPSRLIQDAIKNTNVKMIHRLQAEDDRQAVASCMSLNPHQSRLLATLKKGDAIIHSGQDSAARWVDIEYKTGG